MSLKNATLISLASQMASIAYSLVSVPLLLSQYGKELFGIWGLINGLVAYLSLSNFGIPTAATVYIAISQNLPSSILIYKRSFRLLLLTTFVIAFLLLLSHYFLHWQSIFGKVTTANLGTAKLAASIMIIGFMLKVPLSIAIAGFAGVQRIELSRLYELINSTVAFGGLLGVVNVEGDLVLLAIVISSGSFGVSLFAFAHFSIAFKQGVTQNTFTDKIISYKELITKSFFYFQVGLASTLVWNFNPFLLSHIIGAVAIPYFTIPHRLFALSLGVVTLISGLLVPLYARLAAGNDWDKIHRLYGSLIILLPLVSGCIWIGGSFICQPIINLWIGRSDIEVDPVLVFFLGAYGFIFSKIHTQSALLTALNSARKTATIAWIEALLNLAITIPAVYFLGIAGAAIGTFFAALIGPYSMISTALLLEGVKVSYLRKYERFLIGITIIYALIGALLSNLIRDQIWISILCGCFLILTYLLTFFFGIGRVGRHKFVEMLSKFLRINT